jgi:glycosyltransferase involved in cell wall biosynthesis
MTTRILPFELTEPVPARVDLAGATRALAVLRFHGSPIGALHLDCPDGFLTQAGLLAALDAAEPVRERLSRRALQHWLLHACPAPPPALPTWSAIICTRDRPEQLRRCLEALARAAARPGLPAGEIIVVDNAPSTEETAALAGGLPVTYLREDRPGLNWARQRGAQHASGEVLLYTDDDVVVDENWISALLEPFANPRVAAAAGLVLPLELETPAQELFETYGGFGRGYERRVFDYTNIAPTAAGYVGAGASMALRRSFTLDLALFAAELDAGTATESGGDAYAFYHLLAAGCQIVYTPDALAWHHHRRDYAALRRTLAGYSVGGFAFLTRCLLLHGDLQALIVAFSWLWSDHFAQLGRALLRRPNALPLDLVLAQFAGVPRGVQAYFTTRRRECSPAPAPAPAPTPQPASRPPLQPLPAESTDPPRPIPPPAGPPEAR